MGRTPGGGRRPLAVEVSRYPDNTKNTQSKHNLCVEEAHHGTLRDVLRDDVLHDDGHDGHDGRGDRGGAASTDSRLKCALYLLLKQTMPQKMKRSCC